MSYKLSDLYKRDIYILYTSSRLMEHHEMGWEECMKRDQGEV